MVLVQYSDSDESEYGKFGELLVHRVASTNATDHSHFIYEDHDERPAKRQRVDPQSTTELSKNSYHEPSALVDAPAIPIRSINETLPTETITAIFNAAAEDSGEIRPWDEEEALTKSVRAVVANIQGVCRKWKNIALASPALWSRIDFNDIRGSLECLALCGQKITLHLRAFVTSVDGDVEELLKDSRELFGALKPHIHRASTIHFSGTGSDDMLDSFLRKVVHLRHDRTFPNLQVLHLTNTSDRRTVFYGGRLYLPNLHTLDLEDVFLSHKSNFPRLKSATFFYPTLRYDLFKKYVVRYLCNMPLVESIDLQCLYDSEGDEHGMVLTEDSAQCIVLSHLREFTCIGVSAAAMWLLCSKVDMPHIRNGQSVVHGLKSHMELTKPSGRVPCITRLLNCTCEVNVFLQGTVPGGKEYSHLTLLSSTVPNAGDLEEPYFYPSARPENCCSWMHGYNQARYHESFLDYQTFIVTMDISLRSRVVNLSISLGVLPKCEYHVEYWKALLVSLPRLKHVDVHDVSINNFATLPASTFISALTAVAPGNLARRRTVYPELCSVFFRFAPSRELESLKGRRRNDGVMTQFIYDTYDIRPLIVLRAIWKNKLQVRIGIPEEDLRLVWSLESWRGEYKSLVGSM